ncbi:hypothetical protein ACQW5G_04435 [Fructilactobacillus sp. Tb1]|uniref:hypothetical protein n=1 Tax=Fructilactobacillus sp. Tb1 TaxID=3422304 RepID=UPI003D2CEF73
MKKTGLWMSIIYILVDLYLIYFSVNYLTKIDTPMWLKIVAVLFLLVAMIDLIRTIYKYFKK